jgi:hypothetical protein
MKDNTDMSELWHSLYVNLLYREIRPDGLSCESPVAVEIRTNEY